MSLLRLEDASVTVATSEGDLTILQPLSLTLSEQRIALIGGNGSGKSTLARLLNGLAVPSTGRVTVDGLDVVRDSKEVRRKVAFCFSDPGAQLVMPTAAEDVALSLRKSHRDKRERAAAVATVLERFGLGGLGERSIYALSGGQRQLLAIAGVLATEPDLLVADEPTTLLDLANTTMICNLLLSLPQQLVVATHDLELARRCDRVLLIEAGSVLADGPASEVVDHYLSRHA